MGNPEVGGQEVARPAGHDPQGNLRVGDGVDHLQHRPVPAHGDDHVHTPLDPAGRMATQVALFLNKLAVDLPAGRLEHRLRLADCLADLAALAAPPEHEGAAHPPLPPCLLESAAGSDGGFRHICHRGPKRKAAATTSSHTVPASRPPATSVK